MAMIAGDFKSFLTIKIKQRDDNLFDQYSRIFMVKVLLITSMVCGISWYSDKFNCIIPEKMMVSEDFPAFVGATCWIQGVYIYKELYGRNDDVAYFGITKDIDTDGMYNGELCKTEKKLNKDSNEYCEPMEKTFYQQYQYMPFLLGALALIYYIPYMFHKVVNHDIVKLKNQVDKENPDASAIYRIFFKQHRGKVLSQTPVMHRQILIILVKLTYLVVNIGTFLSFDSCLNGLFVSFGSNWYSWASLENTDRFDYMGGSEFPKPANELLPPFGYCEIWSSAKDIRDTHANRHKVICEISQHVLYQYTFILLWLLIVIGILVSAIGLIVSFFKVFSACMGMRQIGLTPESKKIFRNLTARQWDYLVFLKQQNIGVYGEVRDMFTADISIGEEEPSGSSTPPQMKGWDQSPARNKKDMELSQRPGYAL
ncbi:innexin inx2-like [Clytia hemisphaerica]|eukprot:TCONS_00000247-protein